MINTWKFKFCLEEDIRWVSLDSDLTFRNVKLEFLHEFQPAVSAVSQEIDARPLVFRFRDGDGDLCTISEGSFASWASLSPLPKILVDTARVTEIPVAYIAGSQKVSEASVSPITEGEWNFVRSPNSTSPDEPADRPAAMPQNIPIRRHVGHGGRRGQWRRQEGRRNPAGTRMGWADARHLEGREVLNPFALWKVLNSLCALSESDGVRSEERESQWPLTETVAAMMTFFVPKIQRAISHALRMFAFGEGLAGEARQTPDCQAGLVQKGQRAKEKYAPVWQQMSQEMKLKGMDGTEHLSFSNEAKIGEHADGVEKLLVAFAGLRFEDRRDVALKMADIFVSKYNENASVGDCAPSLLDAANLTAEQLLQNQHTCSGCGVTSWLGVRYKCKTCPLINFCGTCYLASMSLHDPSHEFLGLLPQAGHPREMARNFFGKLFEHLRQERGGFDGGGGGGGRWRQEEMAEGSCFEQE